MATTPALYRQLRFNPLTDFDYIGLINDVPMTLIARGNFPAKDFKEFLDYIKKNKDKVSYANAGIGAASHLCGMLFMSAIQLDLLTVPYKGTGPAMNDLLGGQVHLMFAVASSAPEHVKAGRLRALAVSSAQRSALLPEIPTIAEAGGLPGYDAVAITGMFAPARTPAAIINRLHQENSRVISRPEVRQRFLNNGSETVAGSPEQFTAAIKADIARWTRLVQDSGISDVQ
jgi:tripartite-type tricarboxylate transporter receptor subunit TctC